MAETFRVLSGEAFCGWLREARRVAFFIGAGCSVSSGIPTAGELVLDHWLPRLRDRDAPQERDLSAFARQYLPSYDPTNPATSYGPVIERLFLWPEDRQREIERLCNHRFPGFGYACLANLITDPSGRFNIVLTTNFDDLLADALYLFTTSKPLVIPHESLASYIRATSTTPVIIKLHRDSRLRPRNTQQETATLDEVGNYVCDAIRERTLIFVGYGGNDRGIARMLSRLPEDAPHGGVFWVSGSEPKGDIRLWLDDRKAIWVQIADFDELMLLVKDALALERPDRHRFDAVFEQYLSTYYLLLNRISIRSPGHTDDAALRRAAERIVAFPHRRSRLFSRDGVRGLAGEWPLDDLTLWKFGRALGHAIPAKTARVVLGEDTRSSSGHISALLTAGIKSAGGVALCAGVISTPGVAHLVSHGGFDWGVMISASHSLHTFNGLKVFQADGTRLAGANQAFIENEIDEHYYSAPTFDYQDPVLEPLLREQYVTWLQDLATKRLAGFDCKVVIDCGHGAVGPVIDLVFQNTAVSCAILNKTSDGTDINRDCGSLHPKSVAAVTASVGADLGAALDGDGDRVVFVSSAGDVIDGDQILMALAVHFKARGRLSCNTVIGTTLTSLSLELALAEHGISLQRTHVGDTNVLARMRSGGEVLGGEPSGNLIFSDVSWAGDGVLTLIEVLCLLHETGQSLADLASRLRMFPSVTLEVPASEHRPLDSLLKVNEAIEQANRDLGARGRTVVRYSQTEPVVRVTVEAEDVNKVRLHSLAIARAIEAAIGVPGTEPVIVARAGAA